MSRLCLSQKNLYLIAFHKQVIFLINAVTLVDGIHPTCALPCALSSPLSRGVMRVSRCIHAVLEACTLSEVRTNSVALFPRRLKERPPYTWLFILRHFLYVSSFRFPWSVTQNELVLSLIFQKCPAHKGNSANWDKGSNDEESLIMSTTSTHCQYLWGKRHPASVC